MYSKKQRRIALLACITFIMITFASLFVIVKEADHDCLGDHCPICSVIEKAEESLHNTTDGKPVVTFTIPVIFVFVESFAVFVSFSFVSSFSLVTQKIRMNN